MALPPHKPPHFASHVLKVALRSHALLSSPRLNKGTGFPSTERKAFGIEGRLPYRTNSLDEQCDRAYGQLIARDTPIRKNTFLQSLKEQNWTLYYALLARHLKELVPVIYTPTEAEAIANYSHLFRRSEGLYLTFPNQDTMEEDFLEQTRGRDLDLIVCTDAEAILGIGDQGVGGIGISTAKSVIYTLVGGLDPSKSLSVMLDVGTNNDKLLEDPLYVGWPSKRVQGEEYDQFVDKFVQLVRKYFPHSLLHFEDFGVKNAHRLLDRYHDTHAVFNDDIQGTGAVTLACIMAAIGISRRTRAAKSSKSQDSSSSTSQVDKDRLSDQRYVIFGAGSAGMGIAVQLRDAMVAADGIKREDADKKFWLVDKEGILYASDEEVKDEKEAQGAKKAVVEAKKEFLRSKDEGWGSKQSASSDSKDSNSGVDLLAVVKRARPTVLIGCSTSGGAFKKEILEAMLAGLDADEETKGQRPIILPLSNPSRLAEAEPKDVLGWTKGRALVATGSPFDEVDVEGIKFEIAECNNALIYPGLGFGAILSQSRSVTDTMLLAGAKRLAALSPAISTAKKGEQDDSAQSAQYEYKGESLLPDFGDAPQVNFEVAIAVAEQAVKEGNAGTSVMEEWGVKDIGSLDKEEGMKKLGDVIREKAGARVWVPFYYEYEFDEEGLKEL